MTEVKMEVAPMRSLDDFLLESARFQIPNFSDLEKWNNRIIQNLLYYQTNYFLTYILVFILIAMLHPAQMFYGMLAVGSCIGIITYATHNQQTAFDFKKKHPIITSTIAIIASFLLAHLVGAAIVFIFGILLPIVVIFLHASMRLRSIKNKIANKVEWVGLKKSPMGAILDAIGIEQDFTM